MEGMYDTRNVVIKTCIAPVTIQTMKKKKDIIQAEICVVCPFTAVQDGKKSSIHILH